MGRTSNIVLVLVLAYVSVLNAMIVHVIYKKYLKDRISTPQPRLRFLRNKTDSVVRERPVTPACQAEGKRAMVVVAEKHGETNDPVNSAPALPQLRHALRMNTRVEVEVFVVVTAETFVVSHRAWCNALYTQTEQRDSCHLLLLSSATTANIFHEVLRVSPCTTEVILLPDSVQIKPSIFSRLKQTHPKRVTCLLAETDAKHACAKKAFRVPRLFLEAFTGESSVETAARGMHMYAGAVSVVGMR